MHLVTVHYFRLQIDTEQQGTESVLKF